MWVGVKPSGDLPVAGCNGLAQAKEISGRSEKVVTDIFYSSPQLRAFQTLLVEKRARLVNSRLF